MCAVLRSWCLSVDEPILGSTPALAILGSLITPTPKHSLIKGAVSRIDVGLAFSGRFNINIISVVANAAVVCRFLA